MSSKKRLEFLPQELNLTRNNLFTSSIESRSEVEVFPLNSLEKSDTIEFSSPGYPDKYKDLNEIYLSLTISLLKHDLTKFTGTGDDDSSIINNILYSLFRSYYIQLNNVQISSLDANLGVKEFIETNLNYSKSTAKSRLITQGFIPEGGKEDLQKITGKSKKVLLYGKLNLLNLNKYLPPNVSFYLKLNRQKAEFFLNEDTSKITNQSVCQIHEARLFIDHIRVNDDFLLSTNRFLSSHPINFEYKKVNIITQNISSGTSSINLLNLYTGNRPRLVLAGFVPHKSFTGERSSTPYDFKNPNISSFAFKIDGSNYPEIPYQIENSDTSDGTARIFNALSKTLDLSQTDRHCIVSKEVFDKNFFVILADLTKSHVALSNIMENSSHCTIGITATLSKSLSENYTLVLYLLNDAAFEFSYTNNIQITL